MLQPASLLTSLRGNRRITFAVLSTAVVAYALLQALVIPVLATLKDELHTTQSTVTWVLTAYLLSASIATPIMGRLGDMYGKRRMLVVTMGFLVIGCMIAGLAGTIGVMIFARVIQGFGGGVLPLAFGIVRDEFPKDKISGAVGSISTLTAVGSSAGLVLAGPITNSLGFHWLFWLPMIVCALSGICAFAFVAESPIRELGRLSWLPAILLSGWMIALLLGISEAPDWGWFSPRVLGLLAVAAVLGVAWVFSELRARTPLIDMKMMRRRGVWTNNLVALLVGVSMYAFFAFLPEFVQMPAEAGYGFGASVAQSGLILLPSAVCTFLFGQFSARLAPRFGSRALVTAGSLITGLAYLAFAFIHTELWTVFVITGLGGVGVGLAFAAMSSLIVDAVPASQTGVASGMNANIRTIGGAIGAAVMGSIIASQLQPNGLPKEIGFAVGFAMLGVAGIAAALGSRLIPNGLGDHKLPEDEPAHASMGLLAGGTLVGDKPE